MADRVEEEPSARAEGERSESRSEKRWGWGPSALINVIGALVLCLAAACSGRRVNVAPGPPGMVQEGLASWYGVEEAGRATASGEIMDPERLTAAHPSLPFGSLVRVTALENGKSVDVIVNDRGPHVDGRIIDLSFAAARAIDLVGPGVARVRLSVLGLEGPLAERPLAVPQQQMAEDGVGSDATRSCSPAARIRSAAASGRTCTDYSSSPRA